MKRSSSATLVVVLGISGSLMLAQTDPVQPCCAAVNFQTFNPQDVAIQLVSVERTGPDDITVTWQILNRSKTPQQFDKMAGLAAYQLVWDAEVIDLASRTRFKVASDPKTRIPVAAKHDPPRASQGVGLAAGRTLTTWAKFLVPANVTKVTVTLPGAAQPWENVTVGSPQSIAPAVSTASLPLKDLRLNPIANSIAQVTGGNDASGTVELVEAPPSGGLIVKLASSNPDVVKVPSQVTVSQGTASAETGVVYTARFPIATRAVSEAKSVIITAQAGAQKREADLIVRTPQLLDADLELHDYDTVGDRQVCDSDTYVEFKFQLDGPAPSGDVRVRGVVRLAGSSSPGSLNDGSTNVRVGDRSGSFKVRVGTCHADPGHVCGFSGRVDLKIDGKPSGNDKEVGAKCYASN